MAEFLDTFAGFIHNAQAVQEMSVAMKLSLQNGKRQQNAQASGYSDLREDSRPGRAIGGKAPACYAAAMAEMAELNKLQAQVEYHARLRNSKTLQAARVAENAVRAVAGLDVFRPTWKFFPERIPPLETVIEYEIATIASLQRNVGNAVHHSDGIVQKLEAFDTELLNEFDSAKKNFAMLEERLEKTAQDIAALSEKQEGTPMDSPAYVPQQIELNNLKRREKETRNHLELHGQKIVDTYKQSSQLRAKEDVTRAGLHELRLVNSYVARFMSFYQRTRDADNLLPQLVKTAEAVTSSYQVLTGIVNNGAAETTASVEKLADIIGTVDYRVLPNVQRQVNKQRAILDKVDRKTSFYDQAVTLLRGETHRYQPVQEPSMAAPTGT